MKTKATAVVALICSFAAAGASQSRTRTPVASTLYFTFYSDIQPNLNDALTAAGLARRDKKPELFHSGDETACFEKQAPSVRTAWDLAVDFYAKVISPTSSFAREQMLPRLQLAGFVDALKAPRDQQFVDIVANFRNAAAPAYEACRWPAQEAKNRAWIAALQSQLALHDEAIAARVQQLYQLKWAPPIPVDIVEVVDWSGANTILGDTPGTGHLLIARENPEKNALELVFHEASHILMNPRAPVRDALAKAAAAAGYKLPGDAWHVVLFYMTGEIVRDRLKERGDQNYTPMLYEIFARPTWVEYQKPLESAWRPYVSGSKSPADAARDLIAALMAKP
jgi:hypothetical protein